MTKKNGSYFQQLDYLLIMNPQFYRNWSFEAEKKKKKCGARYSTKLYIYLMFIGLFKDAFSTSQVILWGILLLLLLLYYIILLYYMDYVW
jgi:hypothetical protein